MRGPKEGNAYISFRSLAADAVVCCGGGLVGVARRGGGRREASRRKRSGVVSDVCEGGNLVSRLEGCLVQSKAIDVFVLCFPEAKKLAECL